MHKIRHQRSHYFFLFIILLMSHHIELNAKDYDFNHIKRIFLENLETKNNTREEFIAKESLRSLTRKSSLPRAELNIKLKKSNFDKNLNLLGNNILMERKDAYNISLFLEQPLLDYRHWFIDIPILKIRSKTSLKYKRAWTNENLAFIFLSSLMKLDILRIRIQEKQNYIKYLLDLNQRLTDLRAEGLVKAIDITRIKIRISKIKSEILALAVDEKKLCERVSDIIDKPESPCIQKININIILDDQNELKRIKDRADIKLLHSNLSIAKIRKRASFSSFIPEINLNLGLKQSNINQFSNNREFIVGLELKWQPLQIFTYQIDSSIGQESLLKNKRDYDQKIEEAKREIRILETEKLSDQSILSLSVKESLLWKDELRIHKNFLSKGLARPDEILEILEKLKISNNNIKAGQLKLSIMDLILYLKRGHSLIKAIKNSKGSEINLKHD